MRKKKEQHIISNSTIQSVNNIELVHSGEDFFARLKHVISTAQHEIHLQTYIFENDATGLEIIEALKKAVSRKVKVYILLDGYGSSSFPKNIMTQLTQLGINIRLFSPWYSKNSFYIGRRLHHKIVVADEKIALIGGINIASKYKGKPQEEAWLDYAIQLEHEDIVKPLQKLCEHIYLKKRRNNKKIIYADFNTPHKTSVKILRNDWLKQKNEICNAYINALRKAEKEVIIVGSYFLPGRRLANALKKAAKKGVKINIILSGVSDLPIVMWATNFLYSSLFKQGIELLEWKKSVLHGKSALVDNKWATVGSFNLNRLSSYGSIEMNVEINSPEFCNSFKIQLHEIMEQCEKITPESHQLRNEIGRQFRNWLSYRLIRIALIIATYIPFKRFLKNY